MTGRSPVDRAALALGAVSVASAVFVFVTGDFEFVRIHGGAIVVALGVGLFAVAAGWLGNRLLALAAGAAFLLCAAVLLVLLGVNGNGGFLDGSASTVSLWLGLGVGLVALGVAPREA
jgi:hypothetical protein